MRLCYARGGEHDTEREFFITDVIQIIHPHSCTVLCTHSYRSSFLQMVLPIVVLFGTIPACLLLLSGEAFKEKWGGILDLYDSMRSSTVIILRIVFVLVAPPFGIVEPVHFTGCVFLPNAKLAQIFRKRWGCGGKRQTGLPTVWFGRGEGVACGMKNLRANLTLGRKMQPVHYLYEARAMQDGCGRFVFGGDWRG